MIVRDERLENIQERLIKFTQFDFNGHIPVSKKGDDIDAIIVGLNTLGEELESKTSQSYHDEKRINTLSEVLLKYTLLDFSEQIKISERGDELDAIAVGLNTLSEELQSHIKQVEDSNNQLTSVNKELESFTYSVSHDLRAPLRAIDGFANIMHEDYIHTLDEEGKRLLGVIQFNAKKMGALIDDLLAFSRLGRKEIQKINVNMQELVNKVLLEADKMLNHKAAVKVEQILPAPADYTLMYQVLVNLISNAIKYSAKTKYPKIEIKSEQKNGEVIYSVKDNGAGFDMQYAHKLFGVFQRLHSQEEFEGTGVGLAIVQRIINKHGGKVWAEAELGKGATFNFSLP